METQTPAQRALWATELPSRGPRPGEVLGTRSQPPLSTARARAALSPATVRREDAEHDAAGRSRGVDLPPLAGEHPVGPPRESTGLARC